MKNLDQVFVIVQIQILSDSCIGWSANNFNKVIGWCKGSEIDQLMNDFVIQNAEKGQSRSDVKIDREEKVIHFGHRDVKICFVEMGNEVTSLNLNV